MTIAIVDYGMGNVRSIRNALDYIGEDVVITASEAELDAADRLILPGVGAFGDAMDAINARGLAQPLRRMIVDQCKPMLGICLGMQLLAKTSAEHGAHAGLGFIDADVQPMPVARNAKVPHVGWNTVTPEDTAAWMFDGVPAGQCDFYFVHSFHVVCHDVTDIAATTEHGPRFVSAIARGNICATQFHPEKSQDNGVRLLSNWLERDFA